MYTLSGVMGSSRLIDRAAKEDGSEDCTCQDAAIRSGPWRYAVDLLRILRKRTRSRIGGLRFFRWPRILAGLNGPIAAISYGIYAPASKCGGPVAPRRIPRWF